MNKNYDITHLFSDLTWVVFSFTTEHTSVGLNIALATACEKADSEATVAEDSQETAYAFGIPKVVVSPYLLAGLLKGLNYCNGSYAVSLSPV